MKKRNIILIVVSAAVLVGCILLILWKNNVFSSQKEFTENLFAIEDSSKVTQILLADMHGNNVLLNRKNGQWQLNDGTPVIVEKMEALLSTMMNLRIDHPASQKSIDNINKMMATAAIKVEIHGIAPKFTLFKHGFFEKDRIIKTYYMGPATQDNMGNYAILEGMEEIPCVVCLPGFRGFATPRYSVFREDWISHTLFATKLTRIQEVNITDFDKPEDSFQVEKSGARFFKLYDAQKNIVSQYDTSKLLDFLSQFRNINYESIPDGQTQSEIDSIMQQKPFKIIELEDTDGKKTKLTLFRMPDPYDYVDGEGTHVDKIEFLYNKDKAYAMLNDDKTVLYKIQYYHFDRILQPMSFFLSMRQGQDSHLK